MKQQTLLLFLALLFLIENVYSHSGSAVQYTDGFAVIPLGVGGGLSEKQLSGYVLASGNDLNNWVALDSGNIYYGLNQAVKYDLLHHFNVDTTTYPAAVSFFRNKLVGHLISHPHIDHIAGLVIVSPDDVKTKYVMGLNFTIDSIRDNIFNWKVWPNMGNTGVSPPLGTYEYVPLTEGMDGKRQIPNTQLSVEAYPLCHSDAACYFSTAFLIQQINSVGEAVYVLFLGDTGPDVVGPIHRLSALWDRVAPLAANKKLYGIFIESSYDNSRPTNLLFGHLTPQLIIDELTVLANKTSQISSVNITHALAGLTVVLTHIKQSITYRSSGSIVDDIKTQLQNANNLNVKFHFPQQGVPFGIFNTSYGFAEEVPESYTPPSSNYSVPSSYADGFAVIPLGVTGGLDESSLSGFAFADGDNMTQFIALDIGSSFDGLTAAHNQGYLSFFIPQWNPASNVNPVPYFIRNKMAAYLITHPHLDHILGLIANSPDDIKTKYIMGFNFTINALSENVFNWKSWPNLVKEGPPPLLPTYTYDYITLGDGPANEMMIPNTVLSVEAHPLCHSDAPCFFSTAFLVGKKLSDGSKGYALFLGDTGPDVVGPIPRLSALWERVAPLAANKKLFGIFIESAYDNSRPTNLLFGHLTPQLIISELTVLANKTSKISGSSISEALQGLKVVITHIKPASLISSGDERATIKSQLESANNLNINFVLPVQGVPFGLFAPSVSTSTPTSASSSVRPDIISLFFLVFAFFALRFN